MNNSNLKSKHLDEYPQLRLKDVTFSWPSGIKAIDNCNFHLPKPGLWMLVGSNGSGKSTLFRIISGLEKADSGVIDCDYKPALMFQNPDHQLLLPTCGGDLLFNLPSNLTINQRQHKVKDALKEVGLKGMEFRPIHTLSGGQKQRLALAGALARESTLLLLDEPTALLDPASQTAVLKTVQRLCHRSKNPLAAIWITHRLEELSHADGATRMKNGRVGPWENGNNLMNRLKPLAVQRG